MRNAGESDDDDDSIGQRAKTTFRIISVKTVLLVRSAFGMT